jgi:ABC-type lipoprotein release transport system permease subunit
MYDDEYMIVPLALAKRLFTYEKEISAIEIKLEEGASTASVKKEVKALLGDGFVVKDRYEQQEASFKMMQIEKWMTFLILCFILAIALFNVTGSLSMLMIEKQNDVKTLRNLGAGDALIRRIFLFEGWMISGLGALIGIVSGLILALLQQEAGLIKMGSAGAFVIDSYPVRVAFTDILIVFITVMTIGFLAAWYAVYRLGGRWLAK